jgi:uncharacterized protein (TIGR02466 family)
LTKDRVNQRVLQGFSRRCYPSPRSQGQAMNRQLSVNAIFATPVYTVDLPPDDGAAMNAYLTREVDALMTPRPVLPPGANWQTDPNLHRLPQFGKLVRLMEESGAAVAEFLKLESRDLAVTGLWANLNPPGGRNHWHSHPNNFLAAVYYLETPAGEDHLVFEDPRPQASVMMPKAEFGMFTGNHISFKVQPGRLVLFPAWLKHSVPPNNSTSNRISLAANLMFRRYVEESSPALWEGTVSVDPARTG